MLENVNIIEYFNSGPFIENYSLKTYFNDFIVQEIHENELCDGTEIFDSLKAIKVLKFIREFAKVEIIDQKLENLVKEITEHRQKYFLNKKTDENIENNTINKFFVENNQKIILFKIYIPNKKFRSFLHSFLQSHPLISTKTEENIVSVFYISDNSKKYSFVLKKTNRDTLNACQIIASYLKISYNSIRFCGNKDKRAVTYQKMSITDISFYDLYQIALKLSEEDNGIAIYKIRTCVTSISLGTLKGNRFKIILRPKNKSETFVSENINSQDNFDIEKIKKYLNNGFINYFGNQRFGKNMNNHKIGELIVTKKYKEAIEIIMRSISNESEQIKQARNLYNEKKFKDAYEMFPQRFIAEKTICKGKNRGLSDKKCIENIKKELKSIYLHSYQSYIFNKMVSDRIKQGKNIKLGDFVLQRIKKIPKESTLEEIIASDSYHKLEDTQSYSDVLILDKNIIYDFIEDSEKEIFEEKETWEEKIDKVTDENLHLYSIYDIVIHLKVEKGLKGGYRKVIEKPTDISVSIQDNSILLEFSLSKSTYATMVIREIIGEDILYL